MIGGCIRISGSGTRPATTKKFEFARREGSNQSENMNCRQFLTAVTLAAAASYNVAAGPMGVENSSAEPRQNLVADFEGCNLGLITAHRSELSPAENKLRMANSGPISAIVSGFFRCGDDTCRCLGPSRSKNLLSFFGATLMTAEISRASFGSSEGNLSRTL